MRNNHGIGKFESLTVLVFIIILLGGGMYLILNASFKTKCGVMVKNANKLAEITGSDINVFNYSRDYYLNQAIEDGMISKLDNPFGSGNCDLYESKVNFDSPDYYVTLKCGDYLINNEKSGTDKLNVYKVGEWKETKTNSDDFETKLYNCDDCGVEGSYEAGQFMYQYNKVNGTSYYFEDQLSKVSGVTSKTYYRTQKLVYEG